jgi:hypothetical protein
MVDAFCQVRFACVVGLAANSAYFFDGLGNPRQITLGHWCGDGGSSCGWGGGGRRSCDRRSLAFEEFACYRLLRVVIPIAQL